MLTLRAAFRKRLLKHKDKQGSTAHHKGKQHEHAYYTAPHSRKEPHTWENVAGPGEQPSEMQTEAWRSVHGSPQAGKHKNVKAAVMKAVRAVAKHKDKQGSTEHHTTHEQRMETPHDHWSAPSAGRERFTHTHGYSLRTHGHPRGVTYAKPKSAPIKKHAEHDQSTHGPYNEEDE